MEKQSVMLRFPKTLLNRVDAYKEQKGFGTRTQAIFHLLQIALEQSNNRDSK
ncbi:MULTISPECIES: ribbon-helix-helix domain-containing protein [unclassified Bacillus cereus group]|uniref:ribbon-helix-helix domain-containing protein n=1 Tax=unclassified Bacillus cereus group TaxID=2750818 RepID=UPI001F587DB3|nr:MULTISPECIES: ribbon-helix-helix domain-containing protein [unclassified Bacillus cereus group]